MPVNRLYAPSLPLTGNELHHLRVLRATPGDTFELIDGRGTLSSARLTALSKKEAHFEITSTTTAPEPPPLTLIQALPRPERLSTILEKGTELGVTTFLLFPGERSKPKTTSLKRPTNITIAAIKQCGRLHLPTITLMPPLLEWTDLPLPAIYGDREGPLLISPTSTVIIGPESGLTPQELHHLQHLGATPASLHANILRTDTAAITALVLAQATRPNQTPL